jgi:photosystem II stability/assembly factor-like uncharacterized protein
MPYVPPKCAGDGGLGGPTGTPPTFTTGTWTTISPPNVNFHQDSMANIFTQGLALDPCNPYTLYICASGYNAQTFATIPGGVYRTTDGGATWSVVGNFDQPLNIRVDPRDPTHLYVGDGVRGNTWGFWVSHDAGKTWTQPASFTTATMNASADVYHVEPDPADFNHVLLSFHGGWKSSSQGNGGVFESFDGGDTWTLHPVDNVGDGGWGIFFLYNPKLGIGDNKTWLYGSQGQGYWRTTDAGNTWKQVTQTNMQHGGATTYYTKSGTLYISGNPHIIRSMDNGATWTDLAPSNGYQSVIGDGTNLYTAISIGPAQFLTAPESNDTNWTNLGSQMFADGPFEMATDSAHGIMYADMLSAGVVATKFTP